MFTEIWRIFWVYFLRVRALWWTFLKLAANAEEENSKYGLGKALAAYVRDLGKLRKHNSAST
jgi:hypothetical protein